jgi:hypothetical protein
MKALGPKMDKRMRDMFRRAGVRFPPARIALLAFKEERQLELFAAEADGAFRFVQAWPILAASGGPGLKLREGDKQVPEGFYRLELLNPNSRFHLSLRVNYPNAEDIGRARTEGRSMDNLGSDIMIHGGATSTGCLAIGDPAIEEVFYLAGKTGLDQVDVLLAPRDFRKHAVDVSAAETGGLYRRLQAAMARFPAP